MKDKRKDEDYLTVKEIAHILNVSENTVRNYIKSGDLTPKKTRKRKPYRVQKDVFQEWLDSHSTHEGEYNDDR